VTGFDDRPLRSRLADRLPLLTGLTLLIGLIELVDLGVRLYSRTVGCCPTPTARDVNPGPPPHTGAPWLYPATATHASNASNVVWMRDGG